MPNPALVRNQKCFMVLESTFGTAVTPSGSNACLIISLATQGSQGETPRPDKTGSLGEIVGLPGRKNASWSASLSATPNGAAGVKPDSDVALQLCFGAAGVVVASTSVTYSLGNNQYSASIWNFDDPSTVAQYVAISAVGAQAKFSFGGDYPLFDFSGDCMWALDTDQFADGSMDTIGKGGLGSFPSAPSPTVNGKPPAGFTGAITLDGNTYTTLRTGSITLATARALPKDAFNNYYGVAPVPGLRTVTCDFSIYDDDSANLKALKQKSFNKTLVQLVFQIGTVAGNIMTWTLKNVMLTAPELDWSADRRSLNFRNCRAHDTTIGANDALQLVLT